MITSKMTVTRQSMAMEGVTLVLGVNFIRRMEQKEEILADVTPVQSNQQSSTVVQSWTCPCLLRGN